MAHKFYGMVIRLADNCQQCVDMERFEQHARRGRLSCYCGACILERIKRTSNQSGCNEFGAIIFPVFAAQHYAAGFIELLELLELIELIKIKLIPHHFWEHKRCHKKWVRSALLCHCERR